MRASAEHAIRVAKARRRAHGRETRENEETKGARPKSASETTDDANELFRVDLFARAQPR